jgi:hypothetical protein
MVSTGRKRWPTAFNRFNPNIIIAVLPVTRWFFECGGKTTGGGARYCKLRLTGANLNRANILLGDVAATAEQRQYPARIGIIVATNVHPEPDGIIKTSMVARIARLSAAFGALAAFGPVAAFGTITALWPVTSTITPAAVEHILRSGQLRAVHADERCGNIFGTAFSEQARTKCPVFLFEFNRRKQRFEQAFMIALADVLRRGHTDPLNINLCAAQHHFDALAARIGNDDDCRALFARAARAA